MNFRNKKHKPLEISLTPMIDVVFLLLIFFMVTTTFSKDTAIKVILPQADGELVEKQAHALTLTIDQSGQYFIDDYPLGDNSLETLKKKLITSRNEKDISLIINADANSPVQAAINVLEIAPDIGFKNITFATQKE